MKPASVNGVPLVTTPENTPVPALHTRPRERSSHAAQVIATSPNGNFVTPKIEIENLRSPSYLTDHAIPSLIGRDAAWLKDIWQFPNEILCRCSGRAAPFGNPIANVPRQAAGT